MSDRRFGRFTLEERLTVVGRELETWRAVMVTPTGARKRVALKRLKRGFPSGSEEAKRFLAEAGRSAALVHANVVQVLDYGEVEGVQYVAQELVDGPTLAHVLKRIAERQEPVVPFPIALYLATEVCRGLHVAHQRQVIHGDVSPENVLISWSGQVKLGDFGLVRAAPRLARDAKGRQRHLTPEEVGLAPGDPRFDLFQVGTLLSLMLCGRLPFSGTAEEVARRIVAGEFPRPKAVNPDLPDELSEVVTRALSLQGGYGSAKELQDVLGELFQGSLPGAASTWVSAYLAVFFADELARAGRTLTLPENVVEAIQAVRTSHSTQNLAPVGDAADASSFDLAPVPSPADTREPLEPFDDESVPQAARRSTAETAVLSPVGPAARSAAPPDEPTTDPNQPVVDTSKTMEKKLPVRWWRVAVVGGGVLVTGLIGYGVLRSARAPPPVVAPVRPVAEDWRTPLKRKLAAIAARPVTQNRVIAFRPQLDELGRRLVDVIDDERADAERELRFLDAALDGPEVPAADLPRFDLWLVAQGKALLAEDKFEAAVAALQVCPACPAAHQASTELVDDRAAFEALLEAERAMAANDYATARSMLQAASDARFFRQRFDKVGDRYREVAGATSAPADFFVQPLKEKLGLPRRLARLDAAMTADPVLGWHHRRAWTEVSTQVKSATSQRATLEAAAALDALELAVKTKKR